MDFKNLFSNEESKKNEDSVKILDYLDGICRNKSCDDMSCEDCICCITEDITLKDLHDQIINVCLNGYCKDGIHISEAVLKAAIRNTIKSVESLKESFKKTRDSIMQDLTPEIIRSIQEHMDEDIDIHTIASLFMSED